MCLSVDFDDCDDALEDGAFDDIALEDGAMDGDDICFDGKKEDSVINKDYISHYKGIYMS